MPPTVSSPGSAPTAALTEDSAAVRAVGLRKVYGRGEAAVTALAGVDVAFGRGAFTAIMGPSGSGKSTLMHCLAGLDTATSGQVWLGGTELTALRDRQLTELRRDRIGFVFQAFNLLPVLTAEENLLLPLELAGRRPDRTWMRDVVERLGLTERLSHRPAELSGGQQQRVAVARALLSRPDVVFADEPTGNLDSRAGAEVLDLLRSSVRETGQTVVMVTHDPVAASYADRVVLLADGELAGELLDPTPDDVLEALAGLAAVGRLAAAGRG
ncbi:putative ABC transport system ATP-binding protein [Kineococcus xinjiangensis]|uniref:Putative ABC transport system ATP-binding protein n=1 Tax=Kineococcus xinjiangensis TaxID=512762 RepID=A0A2S6IWH0_9ACTN|nr:ABC transporter ATP-binding protein [Kineococcus xinjiangensis]PPK98580.1 putative ABC transport system ATP-binding protein [Kineococcus xinjiangensis]